MTPAVITSIEQWYPYTNAFALPQGSEIEALEELFAASPYYLECYAENGTSYTAVVEWDFSCIDLNTVGLYQDVYKRQEIGSLKKQTEKHCCYLDRKLADGKAADTVTSF